LQVNRYPLIVSINLVEARKVSIVAWASLIVTVLVTDKIGTDPVNVGKQLAISAFAFSLSPLIFLRGNKLFQREKLTLFAVALFLSATLASVFLSQNPLERGFYGAFGRNTGFLTYLSLSILFIASLQFVKKRSYDKLIAFFFGAVAINVVLSIASVNGFEIFSWNNPNNFVLGTFGNSNFIGAFMGISFSMLFVQLLAKRGEPKSLFLIVFGLGLTGCVVILSNALQGLIVASMGVALAIFYFLRSIKRFYVFSYFYLTSLILVGLLMIMGILQKGPLSSILYKPSVTFRGEYWNAGISMWLNNPLSGVGIDSYGQYYRTYRSLQSTVLPGMAVVTDAAHNVFIDILAGTGIFGFIGYILIIVSVLISALKFIRKHREFDPTFYSLFLGWLAYQVQSVVSINQIGLAIWGWVLGGAVIGYSHVRCSEDELLKISPSQSKSGNQSRKEKSKSISSEGLLDPSTLVKVLASFLIGLLLALPPFVNDAKVRSFLAGKGTSEDFVQLLKQWPRDAYQLNRGVVKLAQSDQVLSARELAAFATTQFPNDYSAWFALYEISGESTQEREAFRSRLHQIDPHNPEFFEK